MSEVRRIVRRTLTDQGVRFITEFEGYRRRPWFDTLGQVWTVGYGSTFKPNGEPVTRFSPVALPRWRARRWLRHHAMRSVGDWINENTRRGLNRNEFDALVSLGYNIGRGALSTSTVWRELQAGNRRKAADAFLMWNKAFVNGTLQVVAGLTRRRKAERAVFLTEPR